MSTIKYQIILLPEWIKESQFIKEYNDEYKNDHIEIENGKVSEYPKILNKHTIVQFLETIRYFGITIENLDTILFEAIYSCFDEAVEKKFKGPRKYNGFGPWNEWNLINNKNICYYR